MLLSIYLLFIYIRMYLYIIFLFCIFLCMYDVQIIRLGKHERTYIIVYWMCTYFYVCTIYIFLVLKYVQIKLSFFVVCIHEYLYGCIYYKLRVNIYKVCTFLFALSVHEFQIVTHTQLYMFTHQ